MVRSLNQIEQEMAALQETVASIAEEFHDVYGQYLDALGQAVRQQLILACYHLCTHGYPDAFLSLTFNQRQELQQKLRQLGQQAQSDIANHLEPIVPRNLAGQAEQAIEAIEDGEAEEEEEEGELDLDESIGGSSASDLGLSSDAGDMDLPTALRFIQKAMEQKAMEQKAMEQKAMEQKAIETQRSESDSESDEAKDEVKNEAEDEAKLGRAESDVLLDISSDDQLNQQTDGETDEDSDDRESTLPPIEDRPLTPKDLLYWQDRMEKSVIEMLYELSHAANRLLHRAEVLPSQLPEPILEVATKAELSAEAMASPPNLLSLMIETRSQGSKRPIMTPIIAVRLRLSEIEFASGSLSVWRSRIRELSARLSKVGRDYYQKQKERSTAQAEAAWRSSWYED